MTARARALAAATAAVALLAPAAARADDPAAATAYNQAVAAEAAGDWPAACKLYEASYHADPQLGVLLHLALCHEHVGRTATAWSEFTDAADLAHSRNDPREATARKHAADLVPELAKLYLAAPSSAPPGLVVRRDGVDVTQLVGTNMPVDPGAHEIAVSAPGYVDWKTTVTAAARATTPLDLPALQKAPEKPAELAPAKDGSVIITTRPGAQIFLDSQPVGAGRYEAKVKAGGHTLRVTAPGMQPYQSEIVVGEAEQRAIDVPLEPVYVTATAPAVDQGTRFEPAVELLGGVKLRGDKPGESGLRASFSARLGARWDFGVFVDAGTISTAGACGFDMAGPMPATPYDFGPRDRFTRCAWVMPGLQLYAHVLSDAPERRIDPYVGITPGFRFGFTDYTPYVGGVAQASRHELFPGIVTGVRVGADYHPLHDHAAWTIGAFVEASITIYGEETSQDAPDSTGQTFVSLLGGLRTAAVF